MINSLRNHPNKTAGFTLIEIIMSIGILALVSIFVMQMYIKANSLKHMAFDKDYAITTAQTALERYKAYGPNPEDWLPAEGLFKENMHVALTDHPYGYTVECYFDREWASVYNKPAEGYTLRLIVEAEPGPNTAGQLMQTDVTVIRHHPYLLGEESDIVLCNLQSRTYFPFLLPERT